LAIRISSAEGVGGLLPLLLPPEMKSRPVVWARLSGFTTSSQWRQTFWSTSCGVRQVCEVRSIA